MDITPNDICAAAKAGEYFRRVEEMYAEMDLAYYEAAGSYGFSCTGCEDNCCLTRFYHHTTIEYAYLLSGFFSLPGDRRRLYLDRAHAYNRELERVNSNNTVFRHMCPVNDAGWCALYAFRPMICRLHGIPHELSPPGRAKIFGAGCTAFENHCGETAHISFDRTPFYTGMADLERRFRMHTGIQVKFRMTVSQMLVSTQTGAL